jgi:hypothetical protein
MHFKRKHPEVEFYEMAVWVENTTLNFGGGALSGRVEPVGYVVRM